MADELQEELDAIKAIFSLPGEVRVESSRTTNSTQCTVIVKPYENVLHIFPNCSLTVVISIPADYPLEMPTFSVFSDDLPRQDLSKLRTKAGQYLQDSAGVLPGILPLLMSLQDEFSLLMSERLGTVVSLTSGLCGYLGRRRRYSPPSIYGSDTFVLLVRIDHMRAKVKYTKTLTNWSTELNLAGRLIFHGKLILNLLTACTEMQIKDYIVRQKAVNVDVDSKGRKCKEKQSSILCEEKFPDRAQPFSDYKVVECEDWTELEQIFSQASLQDIYTKYVKPIHTMR